MSYSTGPCPSSVNSPESGANGASQGGLLVPRPRPVVSLSAGNDLVDLTSDATVVASALARARASNPLIGLVSLGRLRFEAWLEGRMKEPILKKLDIRREVAEAQRRAEEAQNQLRGAQHDLSRSAERNRMEMNDIRRQRLMSDLAAAATPVLTADSGYGGVGSPSITDEQIEALALRAAMNLGPHGEGDDAAWASYRAELYSKLPQNVAREIERRIHEIRAVTR